MMIDGRTDKNTYRRLDEQAYSELGFSDRGFPERGFSFSFRILIIILILLVTAVLVFIFFRTSFGITGGNIGTIEEEVRSDVGKAEDVVSKEGVTDWADPFKEEPVPVQAPPT